MMDIDDPLALIRQAQKRESIEPDDVLINDPDEIANLTKHIAASDQKYSPWLRIEFDEEHISFKIYSVDERMTFVTSFDRSGAFSVLTAIQSFLKGEIMLDARDSRLYG